MATAEQVRQILEQNNLYSLLLHGFRVSSMDHHLLRTKDGLAISDPELLQIISWTPARFGLVPGIGRKRAEAIFSALTALHEAK